ncbi:MAG: hypothetical protein MI746_13655, partial [Pseudomonadales bacterium]|nr:hypothetical protein [Pseudomonadales bacterium]
SYALSQTPKAISTATTIRTAKVTLSSRASRGFWKSGPIILPKHSQITSTTTATEKHTTPVAKKLVKISENGNKNWEKIARNAA